jgi:hypothetical protein
VQDLDQARHQLCVSLELGAGDRESLAQVQDQHRDIVWRGFCEDHLERFCPASGRLPSGELSGDPLATEGIQDPALHAVGAVHTPRTSRNYAAESRAVGAVVDLAGRPLQALQ